MAPAHFASGGCPRSAARTRGRAVCRISRCAALLLLPLLVPPLAAAAPLAATPALRLTPDYGIAIGTFAYTDPQGLPPLGTLIELQSAGRAVWSATSDQRLLLLGEGNLIDTNGLAPATARGLLFAPGRFGQAFAIEPGGTLAFARTVALNPDEGTFAAWVALREDGAAPTYATRTHTLLSYTAGTGSLTVGLSASAGVLYLGGTVNGQWQSAYSGSAATRTWPAGQWHHVACTWSKRGNFMRFYLDGQLRADTNEGRYVPPATTDAPVYLGGDSRGVEARFFLDEVRLLDQAAPLDRIAAWAAATEAAPANAVSIPTAGLVAGATYLLVVTPANGRETGATAASAPWVFPGIPLAHPQPGTSLLAAGTTELPFTITSVSPTACRYAVGAAPPFAAMTPFDSARAGANTTTHTTRIRGLDPRPAGLNEVFIRCAAAPDYVLHLRYRSVPEPDAAPFPRTGNLWGWWQLAHHDLATLAKIDLWLGCDGIPPDTAAALRQRNPRAVFLASINAVEANEGAPADYYLRDTAGNRVETWPGAWRLNLTRPDVADWKARQIAQRLIDSGLLYDGVFFDNVFLSQSWQDHDIYGRPFPYDADGNGVKDDPATFDRLWKEGVLREMTLFRQLMPHALVNGHAMPLTEPVMRETFHGISFGFIIPQIIEGRRSFADVWASYRGWLETVRTPRFTMVESAPPYQIGYGYGYSPTRAMPPATIEWARTWYPNMRFGLAFTLLHDGAFCHEIGDTFHGNDWWYDELDHELGFPLGAARHLELGAPGPEVITNGDFAAPLAASAWSSWADAGARLTVALEADPAGTASRVVRLDVALSDGTDWHASFWAAARTLVKGTNYVLRFRARADRERPLTVGAQKDKADWRSYGLSRQLTLGPAWQDYEVYFSATDNAVADARIQFHVGATTGTVWLDDVSLRAAGPEVWRRDYERGVVLLNATRTGHTVEVGPGFHRLTGTQAPRHQFIVDDADAAFATTAGTWATKRYDTGEWYATPPFYHHWGTGCRESSGPGAVAQWSFTAPDADDFTLDARWPAVPNNTFSAQARYDLLVGGTVVASVTLDQSKQGDEWHRLGTLRANAGATIAVRVQPLDGRPGIADALHVTSAARFNDGSAAASVRLQPMDGIVLRRDTPAFAAPAITRVPAAVSVLAGGTATFTASAQGTGLQWQWQRNGIDLPGATTPALTVPVVQPSQAGNYTVTVRNPAGATTSAAALLIVDPPAAGSARLVNLSTRGTAGAGETALIAGLVIQGDAPKRLLVRAVGPTLDRFGVRGLLADPVLTVQRADGSVVAANDDWDRGANAAEVTAAAAQAGAFALPVGSKDAALVVMLPAAAGAHTVTVSGKDGAIGVVLVEVYDTDSGASSPAARLVNLSTRGPAPAGDGALIPGFVLAGAAPARVLVRGIGPTLADFGVAGVIAEPVLRLFSASGETLQENRGWSLTGNPDELSAAASAAGAFAIKPGSRDAALLLTLAPGAYTAQLTDQAGHGGVGLVEVYAVP